MRQYKSTYTTRDVAAACGVTRGLVARYFRTVNPKRASYTWTTLTEEQFETVVAELRECIEKCPKQPLHGLSKLRAERDGSSSNLALQTTK